MRAQKNHDRSTGPKPPSKVSSASSTGAPSAPRLALPNDLSASLKFLDDADLQRLLVAVNTEIDRRRRGASTPGIGSTAPVTGSRPVPARDQHTNIAEIPEGKANLIRAAFGAGLKTPGIARTFGISLSQVNRVIRSTGKPIHRVRRQSRLKSRAGKVARGVGRQHQRGNW
jgi:hypothetical protein